jgi:arsenical pump membrane protein
MLSAPASAILIWAISIVSILCMLVRPRRIAEAYWVCAGGIVLVLTRLLPVAQAAHGVLEGWDVYLFLTGMMILAELAREEGVFDWIADLAARRAHNSPARLFLLIYLVGTVVTAILSNDATAVVLTPAVLAVVRRSRLKPKPYLLACAFIANAASFVFPISNPANLVVFDQHMPPLGTWLRVFLLPSAAAILVTFLCLRWLSRRELYGEIRDTEMHSDALRDAVHTDAIHNDAAHNDVTRMLLSTEGKLALAGLAVAATTLVTYSALGLSLGTPTCCSAVAAVGVVAARDRAIPGRIAKGVSWSVLPLVAGLFVIVEALQNAGLLRLGLLGMETLASMPAWASKASAALGVALLSNGVNNLPVGLMSGVAIRHAQDTGIVAHAILVGVDLGPNLSVTGSLATILWLIALRRENVEITAREFLKFGAIAMPLALAAALLFLRN